MRGNLDKITQHGKRADSIVKNMLLHSREGSGKHRLVDANALVKESLNLAYHGARAENQSFNLRGPRLAPSPPTESSAAEAFLLAADIRSVGGQTYAAAQPAMFNKVQGRVIF